MEHYFYQSVSSTTDISDQLITHKSVNNTYTTITAKMQTKGRGKNKNQWYSTPGNIHSSVIIKVGDGFFNIQDYLPFISPIAIVNALKIEHNAIKYKWPNDILYNGLKFCGILCQNYNEYVVISFGINLIDNPDNIKNSTNLLRENILEKGLNINLVSEVEWRKNIEYFLENFIASLNDLYNKCINYGFDVVKNLWLRSCYNINNNISVMYNNKMYSGRFIDINNKGEIVLQVDGKNMTISTADIIDS